jgi:hypothetical protein
MDLIEQVKRNIRDLEETKEQIKQEYVEMNRPCELDRMVEIELGSGRKVTGIVKKFGILGDKEVCVTAYQVGTGMKYITTPHKGIKVLS